MDERNFGDIFCRLYSLLEPVPQAKCCVFLRWRRLTGKGLGFDLVQPKAECVPGEQTGIPLEMTEGFRVKLACRI